MWINNVFKVSLFLLIMMIKIFDGAELLDD